MSRGLGDGFAATACATHFASTQGLHWRPHGASNAAGAYDLLDDKDKFVQIR